jgi:hypothetical protein
MSGGEQTGDGGAVASAEVAFGLRDEVKVTCQVDAATFVHAAGRDAQIEQGVPGIGAQVGRRP